MTDEAKRVLDRFIEACQTGRDMRTGPRKVMSPAGLGLLKKHKLWPDMMRRVSELGSVHPDAQCPADHDTFGSMI